MRMRHAFGLTVAAASAVLGLPIPASAAPAASAGTLLVNNAPGAGCSDSGGGTADRPFCTIGAAAAVVQPGQTVRVMPGQYGEEVRITRSGTPEQPIVFTGAPLTVFNSLQPAIRPTSGKPSVTLEGVHDVVVHGFLDDGGTGFQVTDSTRVGVDQNWFHLRSVQVGGTSDHVTVSRNLFDRSEGLVVAAGVTNTLVTANDFNLATGSAVSATDTPDLAVTNNTIVLPCVSAVAVDGTSPRAIVKNNVTTTVAPIGTESDGPRCTPSATAPSISVSAASAATATVDYNTVHPRPGTSGYRWGDSSYATPQAFAAATGQGVHDVDLTLDYSSRKSWEPFNRLNDAAVGAIDSADPTAPGIGTDMSGQPAVDDPKVPNTGPNGSVKDRGAYELSGMLWGTLGIKGAETPTAQGPIPLTVQASASASNDWGTPSKSYEFDFGDGSDPVVSASDTVNHTYTRTGAYRVSAVVVDAAGGRAHTLDRTVWANPPAELSADFGAKNVGWPLTYQVDVSDHSPWAIARRTVDFGDGTVTDLPGITTSIQHAYQQPGTYTVTATVGDEGGRNVTATKQVTVAYDPSVAVLQPGERVQVLAQHSNGLFNGGAHYGYGLWAPFTPVGAGNAPFQDGTVTSTTIAATSDQVAHNLATANGRLYIADRLIQPGHWEKVGWWVPDGKWNDWAEVTAPGAAGPLPGAPDQIASATIGNTLHVLALVNGTVYQTTADYAAGRWTGWANVSAATGLGTTTKISAAATGNSLHIATLDSFGRAYIADGNYDRGTWSSGELTAILGTPSGRPANQIAAASTGDKLHVVVLDYGTVRQAIGDYAAGRWTGWNDITAPAGTQIGNIDRIAAAGTGNKLQVYALAGGSLYNATGDYDRGRWAPWAPVSTGQKDRTLTEIAVTGA
ncbi:PKD domain-containing protein [Kitasatospora sp. NPDC087314]|uniref:PKD domain-containing protein n=1 Tax=Kitasatospora sp. NPDC087314 TaxID=3364068 RepID=UPI0037F71EDF